MTTLTLLDKTYNGESIVDAYRDCSEAIDGDHNPVIQEIPQDEYGFSRGNFRIIIQWQDEQ